jgi:hypothetical protein
MTIFKSGNNLKGLQSLKCSTVWQIPINISEEPEASFFSHGIITSQNYTI